MAHLEVTNPARRDLRTILRYLAEKGGHGPARDFAEAFDVLGARLLEFPQAYEPRPSLGRAVRVALIRPYLILYQHHPQTDGVTILRVFPGRRAIGADFLEMP